jgi:chromosome segregation ATPase
MRRSRLSARVERHLERGEELMELNRAAFQRNEAAFERNTQAFERLMEAMDRHERAFEESREDRDDLKQFIREMNMRSEKRFQEWLRRQEEVHAEQTARTDAIVRHLDDLSQESRAQRGALLALIDRLPPSKAA